MNLSRLRMNGVARPLVSGSSTTWLSGNGSTSRLGGVMITTGTLTTTIAFGVNEVPGTRPMTWYEPGFSTCVLSVGAGQITRTGGPDRRPRYTPGTLTGSRGIIPTPVSTVMSGTF